MKDSSYQYLLATGWLPVCWKWAWAIVAVCMAMRMTDISLGSMAAWPNVTALAKVVVLAFLTGWYASIVPAWFVFGPMLYHQGIENGGPFVPGDKVRIIAGKHRGRVARVYDTGQYETVRVELGETEKARYADFFAAYELVREAGGEREAASESSARNL